MSLIGKALSLRNQGKPPIPLDNGSRARRGLAFNLGVGRADAETHMRQYGMSGTIYGIVSLLAESAATPMWHLYKKAPVDGRRRYSTADHGSDQRIEVVQHAAIQLLNNPNDWHSRFEFFEGAQQHEELAGETFWVLDTEAGFPTAMWYVRPDRMEPVPDPDDYLLGWIYRGPNGEQIPLKTSEVILEKRPDPLDPYRGAGPVAAILPNIQQQRYATEYQRNLFLNGADPGGVITVPNRLSEPEFDDLVDRWRESHRGVARAGQIGVLENGAVWTPNAHSNKDMEYGQLRLANRDELREAWRIHKSMLGTSDDVNRCHDDQTEVLTDSGWKPFEKVEDGDRIATVDPATRRLEYHLPIHRFAYDYCGPMVRIDNGLADVKVTPNHTMLIATPYRKPWRTTRADELPNRFNTMAAVEAEDAADRETFALPAVEYDNGHTGRGQTQLLPMDPWLEFLGWVISEGGILSEERAGGRYVMTLAQKKYPQRIRDCLAALPFAAHEYDGGDGLARWNITGKGLISWLREHVGTNCHDKRIPRWCFDLSRRQRSILFDAMMAGDGSRDSRAGRDSGYYATSSPGLADDVLEFAFRLGYRASVAGHQDPRAKRAPMYYVHLSQRPTVQVMQRSITTEHYEGKVYSFEVPNHVYVTRRNGRIAIHGNSNAQTAQEVFVAWQIIPRLNRRRDTLNCKLLPLFGRADKTVEFDYEDPSPTNAETAATEMLQKAQAAQALIGTGRFDPRDVLEAVGLPDMDVVDVAAAASPALPAPNAGELGDQGQNSGRTQITMRRPLALTATPTAPPHDLSRLDEQWKKAVAAAVAAYLAHVVPAQRAQIAEQIAQLVDDGDITGLASLTVDSDTGAQLLSTVMAALAGACADDAAGEAHAQGATGVQPTPPDRDDIDAVAKAVAGLAAASLALAAAGQATRLALADPEADGADIADEVDGYLDDLSDASLTARISGAMSAAQNNARINTFLSGPSADLFASEVNDRNSCGPCRAIDGEYIGNTADDNIEDEIAALYPNGGYIDCAGGDRCRGTIIAAYGSENDIGNHHTVLIRAGKDAAAKVFTQIAEDFPPAATAWMHHATWSGPVPVPLEHIDWTPAGMEGKDPDRVAAFAARLQAGKKLKPVVLVKTPGADKLQLVDGHHRYLASAELKAPVRAFIGVVDADHGPWETMHGQQYASHNNRARPAITAAATLTKQQVHYRDAAEPGRRCGTCAMFRTPNSCTLVKGLIETSGVCDRWAAKTGAADYTPTVQAWTSFNPSVEQHMWNSAGAR